MIPLEGSAYGILSLIPPLVAITLAIKTKRAIFSLSIGVIVGYFIFVNFAPAGAALEVSNPILGPAYEGINAVFGVLTSLENMELMIFIGLLGGFVEVVSNAGGSMAFAQWAAKHVKTRLGAQLLAFFLGIFIFIDDYFNALTVGNVMQPIYERFNISKARLAYNDDSTAAPVTILFPISSWVATVIALMNPNLTKYGFSISGINAFLSTLPYNYYAWLTLLMVLLSAVWDINIGPMAKYEAAAKAGNDITDELRFGEIPDWGDKGDAHASDLIVPMLVLIASTVLLMLAEGGYFAGESMLVAFGNVDTSLVLTHATVVSLFFSFLLYVPRKLHTTKSFMGAFSQGFKSMIDTMLLLVLAWSLAGVMDDAVLGTGTYVASLVPVETPGMLLPALLFVVTAAISFTSGVSWGAMAIMTPMSITICAAVAPEEISVVLGAVLAGVIFGDHCSPISDTTILSSTGAGCNHMAHVNSQLPYALTVGACSIVACLFAGWSKNAIFSMAFAFALLVVVALCLRAYSRTHVPEAPAAEELAGAQPASQE
ncbi:MAG: Na+/H+ antiporter NhaC family protein [Olsenella sp.]|nr:Na+/H+ antiporter NhaC family protein [Olsenella sp.]